MGILFNLMQSAIRWAFFLAMIAGLGEATVTMYLKAGHARAHGLISLTALNHALVGPGPARK